MSHFETEQLEMKESTIPAIIEEAEKHNTALCDELLALNLWGRKWNLIVHGITGELKEFSDVSRQKFQEFIKTILKMDPIDLKNIHIAACHRIRGSRDVSKASLIIRFVDLQLRRSCSQSSQESPKGVGLRSYGRSATRACQT